MKFAGTQCDQTFRDVWPELCAKPLGIDVDAKAAKDGQTNPQRKYYWRSLNAWGRELGYTVKETEMYLHNSILCEAYGVKECKRIGRSIIEIPNQRSSKSNREDYSLLIETLILVAAETGFAIEPAERR